MAVITISRQVGCGTEEISELVAKKLGFKFFHKELIKYISILTDTDENKVMQYDEDSHSTFRSFISNIFDPETFTGIFKNNKIDEVNEMLKNDTRLSFFDTYADVEPVFDSKRFNSMVELVIKSLARDTNCVIMGRGGQCILSDIPNCFHLRLVAPFEDRKKWFIEQEGLSASDAVEKIKEIEKRKKSYLKHFYGKDIDDTDLYNAVLNVSRSNVEQLSDIIAAIGKEYLEY